MLVSITAWSPSASLQIKGLATKYTTVTWLFMKTLVMQRFGGVYLGLSYEKSVVLLLYTMPT